MAKAILLISIATWASGQSTTLDSMDRAFEPLKNVALDAADSMWDWRAMAATIMASLITTVLHWTATALDPCEWDIAQSKEMRMGN